MTIPAVKAWPATRFAGLSRRTALAVFAFLLAFVGLCLRDSASVPNRTIGATTVPDVEYHRNVVERVRDGQSYHDAAHAELTGLHYPTHSLFNWRLPTYAWFLGALPNAAWSVWVFRFAALFSVVAAVRTALGDLPVPGVLAGLVLLLAGAFAWSVIEPDAPLTPEPWCEVLILFSLSASASGRYWLGMALAVAALSVRELALPYCVVGAAWSCYRGRWREIAAWAVAFALLGAFFLWHALEIRHRQHDVAPAAVESWFHFRGFDFVLLSSTMNVLLQSLPTWMLAVVVPLALLGLMGWRSPLGGQVAAIAAIYTAAYFCFRGGEYWGFCHTVLIVMGLVRSPAACRDLYWALVAKRQVAEPPSST